LLGKKKEEKKRNQKAFVFRPIDLLFLQAPFLVFIK
jgi:hypothetical protein